MLYFIFLWLIFLFKDAYLAWWWSSGLTEGEKSLAMRNLVRRLWPKFLAYRKHLHLCFLPLHHLILSIPTSPMVIPGPIIFCLLLCSPAIHFSLCNQRIFVKSKSAHVTPLLKPSMSNPNSDYKVLHKLGRLVLFSPISRHLSPFTPKHVSCHFMQSQPTY